MPGRTCADCGAPIADRNTIGYCKSHRWIHYRGRKAVAGHCESCGKDLLKRNPAVRFCAACRVVGKRVRRAEGRVPRLCAGGCGAEVAVQNKDGRCPACREAGRVRLTCTGEGCGVALRADNVTGYCKSHRWIHYRQAAIRAKLERQAAAQREAEMRAERERREAGRERRAAAGRERRAAAERARYAAQDKLPPGLVPLEDIKDPAARQVVADMRRLAAWIAEDRRRRGIPPEGLAPKPCEGPVKRDFAEHLERAGAA